MRAKQCHCYTRCSRPNSCPGRLDMFNESHVVTYARSVLKQSGESGAGTVACSTCPLATRRFEHSDRNSYEPGYCMRCALVRKRKNVQLYAQSRLCLLRWCCSYKSYEDSTPWRLSL